MLRQRRMVRGTVLAACLLGAACSSGLPDDDKAGNGAGQRSKNESGSMAQAGSAAGSSGGKASAGAGAAGEKLASGAGGAKAAGSGGTAGSMAAGGTGAAGQNAMGDDPCSEQLANDTRDTATAYTAGTDALACLTGGDSDWYELTAPGDNAAGGYYVGSAIISDGNISVTIFTVSDNAEVFAVFRGGRGVSVYFYWAAALGQKYRVQVKPYTTAPNLAAKYTLRLDYTKLEDAREPDDTRDTAKPISLGTPAESYFFAGHIANELSAAQLEDWYAFDAGMGMLSIKLENVAMNIDASVQLVGSDGANVGSRAGSDNAGASIMAQRMIPAAGHYFLVVKAPPALKGVSYGDTMSAGVTPDNFTRPYTLTISQP